MGLRREVRRCWDGHDPLPDSVWGTCSVIEGGLILPAWKERGDWSLDLRVGAAIDVAQGYLRDPWPDPYGIRASLGCAYVQGERSPDAPSPGLAYPLQRSADGVAL